MIWKHYALIFRLVSPLHVGYRKVGNLMQTRPYVPGKMLWAALTARLTRDSERGNNPSAYDEIGEKVKEYFRFGYLYPAMPRNPSGQVLEEKDLDIYYHWSEQKFDYYFLDSYASTAIDHNTKTVDEGTLHEVEFIRPFSRLQKSGVSLPVYMVGELWVNDPVEYDWQKALKNIQIGGERGYGWGNLKLVNCLEIDKNEPKIKIRKGEFVWAHVNAQGQGIDGILQGVVEPLVGWERDNRNGAKPWRISQPVIAFRPGSRATADAFFTVGSFGIWKKEST